MDKQRRPTKSYVGIERFVGQGDPEHIVRVPLHAPNFDKGNSLATHTVPMP